MRVLGVNAFVGQFSERRQGNVMRQRTLAVAFRDHRWYVPLGRWHPKCHECQRMGRNCSLHVGQSREGAS